MGIIDEVRIRNFKCFRTEVRIPLTQGTYLAGPNNSGKTAILEALRCFFDDAAFKASYINQTELAAKRKGSNRSDIAVVLNLGAVSGKDRKKRLQDAYGGTLNVRKAISWREATETTSVDYFCNGQRFVWESLPPDVRGLIESISVSYIHPQEGAELLAKAQDKFKQRLFQNWGRHASVAEQVKSIEVEWDGLRATANSYLSSALTTRLREIWPNAEVVVELPEHIREVVAVSDITFRSSPNLPRISLTSHGTGSQSAILYQTHYVLDSDRSLHRGQYYPVWLIEEPESFLHADIAFQISRLLSSDEWLDSIQMVISTHSPIILAGSTRNPQQTSWVLCDVGNVSAIYKVDAVQEPQINEVGAMMGDGSFGIYFQAGQSDCQVYLEDSRPATVEKIREVGVPNPIPLEGAGDVNRHLLVLSPLGGAAGQFYFVVDNDNGARELKKWIDEGEEVAVENGWRKLDCGGDCYLILLPHGSAMEHLFDKWPEVLQTALEDLYDLSKKRLKDVSPMDLTRAAGVLRNSAPADPDLAKTILARQQDVKDRFWCQAHAAAMVPEHESALLRLLNY